MDTYYVERQVSIPLVDLCALIYQSVGLSVCRSGGHYISQLFGQSLSYSFNNFSMVILDFLEIK